MVLSRLREGGAGRRILCGCAGPQGPGFVASDLETPLSVMGAEGYLPAEAAAVLSGNFTGPLDLPDVAW